MGKIKNAPNVRQLRSSRSTRNQEHNTAPRNRAGVIDWDPTEGLPVRKWEQVTVKVNQDVSTDPSDTNNQNQEHIDNDFPWPEQPLPHFFNQLAPHSQELLRRARMGNTAVKMPTWDRKTESWISSSELDARNARLKSKHLLNNPESPNSHNEDEEDDENDDAFDADGLPEKRRKTNSGVQERVFETKKWVQIPAAIAEKLPEPKYLADRRPGMESLYGGAYKATNGFGALGLSPGTGSANVGYDLGDGSGLGNAAGVLGTTNPVQESTPVRKNIPPKRKKKKLGGPGRKKANPNPTGDNAVTTMSGDTTTGIPTGDNQPSATTDIQMRDNQNGEGEGSGSESEGEGSEEGEIEEGGKTEPDATAQTTAADQENLSAEPNNDQVSEAEVEPEPAIEVTGTSLTAPNSEIITTISTDAETQQATVVETLSEAHDHHEPAAHQHIETIQASAPETEPQSLSITDTLLAEPVPPPVVEVADETPTEPSAIITPAAEPELVLEQGPIVEEVKPAGSEPEPTSDEVKTVDTVAVDFETVQEAPQTETAEQVDKDNEPVSRSTEPMNQEQEQAQEEEKISTEGGAEAQATAEMDLLGGLEAAVEKEHEAV
ncbi:uncharacterized protein Z518_05583 [Rhinocladiella mackenziei CBS 650.93]|uniref:Uncharacterized protein n=1 Tax=Rhinocladiella mackenziei CBS 650.93 TaxID=1442369 RepID=A0A0D2H2Q5_9EURO|nr:uncharacterized protein Z518_05583 [Rhinocladiella mackenziei CBS 650.93]KIX04713.1 hypothetical protein Z518_05583 [Rhinocladiella mackenziei CBS 650.93]